MVKYIETEHIHVSKDLFPPALSNTPSEPSSDIQTACALSHLASCFAAPDNNQANNGAGSINGALLAAEVDVASKAVTLENNIKLSDELRMMLMAEIEKDLASTYAKRLLNPESKNFLFSDFENELKNSKKTSEKEVENEQSEHIDRHSTVSNIDAFKEAARLEVLDASQEKQKLHREILA